MAPPPRPYRPILAPLCCALVLLAGAPGALAAPAAAPKILIVDDNTLDVEQAFLRPPRRQRHELVVTLAGTVATPLQQHQGPPVVQSMLQADAVLRANDVALVSIVRLRLDDVTQPVAQSRLFFHQVYLTARHRFGEVKLGKIMGQLGRLWDYGLYGPLLANADFKLTPDLGISAEGDLRRGRSPWQLAYAAQFSIVDGRSISASNAALFATANVRRRNIATLRLVPIFAGERARLALGVSGQLYEAIKPAPHWVGRMAVDLDFTAGPLESFFEVGRQTAPDLPSAGGFVQGPFNYLWAGAQVRLPAAVRLRHHVNIMRYEAGPKALDILQQPGIEYEPLRWLTLVIEGALWTSNAVPARGEKSLLAFAIVSL